MSEPKSESVPVLSRASEYKVWRAKMMGYLIFIEADDALYVGDLKDPTYKKSQCPCLWHNPDADGHLAASPSGFNG